MADTMKMGELYFLLGQALHADPRLFDQPLFAGDPDEPETIDGLMFHGPSNDWHLSTSPVALEDRFVNEATNARKHGEDFTPNTELYGKTIMIVPADEDASRRIEGKLVSIDGSHNYTINVAGRNQEWTVDSVNDLTDDEDGLTLWNAWRP